MTEKAHLGSGLAVPEDFLKHKERLAARDRAELRDELQKARHAIESVYEDLLTHLPQSCIRTPMTPGTAKTIRPRRSRQYTPAATRSGQAATLSHDEPQWQSWIEESMQQGSKFQSVYKWATHCMLHIPDTVSRSALSAKIACAVLDKLMHSICGDLKVWLMIRKEIFSAIFPAYTEDPAAETLNLTTRGGDHQAEPQAWKNLRGQSYASALREAEDANQTLRHQLVKSSKVKSVLSAILESSNERERHNSLAITFNAWRGHTRALVRRRSTSLTVVDSLRSRVVKARVLHSWKLAVVKLKGEHLRLSIVELKRGSLVANEQHSIMMTSLRQEYTMETTRLEEAVRSERELRSIQTALVSDELVGAQKTTQKMHERLKAAEESAEMYHQLSVDMVSRHFMFSTATVDGIVSPALLLQRAIEDKHSPAVIRRFLVNVALEWLNECLSQTSVPEAKRVRNLVTDVADGRALRLLFDIVNGERSHEWSVAAVTTTMLRSHLLDLINKSFSVLPIVPAFAAAPQSIILEDLQLATFEVNNTLLVLTLLQAALIRVIAHQSYRSFSEPQPHSQFMFPDLMSVIRSFCGEDLASPRASPSRRPSLMATLKSPVQRKSVIAQIVGSPMTSSTRRKSAAVNAEMATSRKGSLERAPSEPVKVETEQEVEEAVSAVIAKYGAGPKRFDDLTGSSPGDDVAGMGPTSEASMMQTKMLSAGVAREFAIKLLSVIHCALFQLRVVI